jgi:hypothetical protein
VPLFAEHVHAQRQQAQAGCRAIRVAAVRALAHCVAVFIEFSVYRAKSSSQKQIRPVPPRLLERCRLPPLCYFGMVPAD